MPHRTAKVIDIDPEPAMPEIAISAENSGARFAIVVLNSVSLDGVLFNNNAQLDLSGSITMSTADFIKLGDGGRFDVLVPVNSVLNSAQPEAFGFVSTNPTGITMDNSEIVIEANQAIAVIAGDIRVSGGSLQTLGGKLSLVSVGSEGEVVIDIFNPSTGITVDSFTNLGNIAVEEQTVPRTSGSGAGDIYIQGGQFTINNANVFAGTTGNIDGGIIDIDLTVTSPPAPPFVSPEVLANIPVNCSLPLPSNRVEAVSIRMLPALPSPEEVARI